MKKILVFASGSSDGGRSGFRKLVEGSLSGILKAEIISVVSNYPSGGVKRIADQFGIDFTCLGGPFNEERYRQIVKRYDPDLIALSGWIKLTKGLDPGTTINIHPGPLPQFGGKGMHGHHAHEAIIKAYSEGKILFSAASMHFVTDKYDKGPIFFSYAAYIGPGYDADKIGAEVNKIEHGWQAYITNLVLEGKIYWDGINPESLVVPDYVPRILIKVSQ
ncbi:MAG: formyltransferase family protein [Minisyncoccia bacterium]